MEVGSGQSRDRGRRIAKWSQKSKVMLITFFDEKDIIRSEFLLKSQTINSLIHQEIQRHIHHSVRVKRRELWQYKSWLLHHDNASAYKRPEHPAVLGWKVYCSIRKTSLFTWSRFVLLFPFPQTQENNQRNQFWRHNIAVLEQPPYSPDLALCDFFLFPKLKRIIKETRSEGAEAIKRAVMVEPISYRSYGNQTWSIKWNAVSSRQQSYR